MNTFGESQIKQEGEIVRIDPTFNEPDPTPREDTYYFEQAFTKKEFAELAHALSVAMAKDGRTPLLDKVWGTFVQMSKNGYGEGR